MKKVIVGLSGGVDSALTALLLKEQNYDVTGVIMSIWDKSMPAPKEGAGGCFGPEEEDIESARAVAKFLDIPFKVLDCRQEYKDIVLENFRSEYEIGRTPNPCIWCNSLVKFGALPRAARAGGLVFDKFATGHYAAVGYNAALRRWQLKRAKDEAKDQTYFLYRLTQEQLSQILFPLGSYTKDEVRALALKYNLPVAKKRDSQDFYCGDYNDILKFAPRAGNIVDKEDNIVGRHQGIWNYTIGKRKGLTEGGTGAPVYVIKLDAQKNEVVIGRKEDLFSKTLTVKEINWLSIEEPSCQIKSQVKIRRSHLGAQATLKPLGEGRAEIVFDNPQMSVTAGQSAVFYDGNLVLRGGIIA